MAYDNTNSGALFVNDKKTKENHPNARGQAEVVCPHCKKSGTFWLSAWTKVAKQGKKAGQKFQSLAFTEMDDQPNGAAQESVATNNDSDNFDDDIPF
tara:strand:+ start:18018 stop:18308 length:291 start_codon:yes stop_codon:yes gene_type:complete